MIGYYVHHQGAGHLHRATAIAEALGLPVTGLSSLPRPSEWAGEWIELPRDDTDPAPLDRSAGGALHWAPLADGGQRARTAAISAWIEAARPEAVVVDVSVEVALTVRLHGVPVISVVLPGERGDPAHRLGRQVSGALLAFWPAVAGELVHGLDDADRTRLACVGGLSRFAVEEPAERAPGPPRVLLLGGRGGEAPGHASVEAARMRTPGWAWTVLDGSPETWTAEPAAEIRRADVVITHAGQNAIAEVAAARRPAIVIPAERPHHEQRATARALGSGDWPAVVLDRWPGDGRSHDRSEDGWPALLERAAALDGRRWKDWCDGGAAGRAARLIHAVVRDPAPRR